MGTLVQFPTGGCGFEDFTSVLYTRQSVRNSKQLHVASEHGSLPYGARNCRKNGVNAHFLPRIKLYVSKSFRMVFTHYISVELALREDIHFFPTVLSEKHRLAVSTDPHDGAGSLRKPSKREPSRAEPS